MRHTRTASEDQNTLAETLGAMPARLNAIFHVLAQQEMEKRRSPLV